MILFGDTDGIRFKYNNLLCILNEKFNIVLFVNSTFLDCNSLEYDNKVGFVIPTKYLSFIKTINKKYSYFTKPSSIFKFENLNDEKKLEEFIKTQMKDNKFKLIKDLVQPLRSK